MSVTIVSQLQIGDVVALKGATDIPMTVIECNSQFVQHVTCGWFNKEKEFIKQRFHADSLVSVPYVGTTSDAGSSIPGFNKQVTDR